MDSVKNNTIDDDEENLPSLSDFQELDDVLEEENIQADCEDYLPSGNPFKLEDFEEEVRSRREVRKDFEDQLFAAEVCQYLDETEKYDVELGNDYFIRVFGSDFQRFRDMTAGNFSTLWTAVKRRDYRLLIDRFSKRSKYVNVDYSMVTLGTGYQVIVSQGKLFILSPASRNLFFPTGVYLPGYSNIEVSDGQGGTREIKGSKDRVSLSSDAITYLARFAQKAPQIFQKFSISELLNILEENTKLGDKVK